MPLKFLLFGSFFILFQPIYSQSILLGKVINAETKEPLVSASVFLSNTSIGVTTSKNGTFKLSNIPNGKSNLVVSFVGYETFVKVIESNNLPGELVIQLRPKTTQLDEVVLEPFEVNGWEKWGQFFLDNFIGTSSYAKNCELKNKDIIKFRDNKKNSTLEVYALEPLVIENNSLGYEIQYKLEEFEYNYKTKLLVYNGYPLFKDRVPENSTKARRWLEKRKIVYNGSLMHFMRAFFVNKLETEGFEIRSLSYIPNILKSRALKLLKDSNQLVLKNTIDSFSIEGQTIRKTTTTIDSTEIFRNALKQPDSLISRELISADSIGFAIDSSTAGIYSKDSIEISYLFKEVPIEYKRLSSKHKFEKIPVSQFTFISKTPVAILSNGYHYGPHDLKITGYWAWSETIATMLPFNYSYPKNE